MLFLFTWRYLMTDLFRGMFCYGKDNNKPVVKLEPFESLDSATFVYVCVCVCVLENKTEYL